MEPHDPAVESRWRADQLALKARLVAEDNHRDWDLDANPPRLIGGVDISFIKDNDVDALAMLAILRYPDLEVVHTVSCMVELTAPYIPGFLAFREVGHIVALLEKLKAENPIFLPQVVFVDGNGTLHPHEFGLACHLGVLADVPTIGIGKTIMSIDGLHEEWNKKRMVPGSDAPLIGASDGKVWGRAVAAPSSAKPVFVSVGHRVSLATAVELTKLVTRTRIPEPIRAADLTSRDILREMEAGGS